MPRSFDPDPPLKPQEARRFLSNVLRDGDVAFTRHARREMVNDGILRRDVFAVLTGGWIDPAELEGGAWRYRVHSARFCVVVELETVTFAVVVTAWRKT